MTTPHLIIICVTVFLCVAVAVPALLNCIRDCVMAASGGSQAIADREAAAAKATAQEARAFWTS